MSILGVGTEVVEVLRIARMIERHGELFIGRVYTEHEIEFCASRKAANQHYAGRWAAKEAVLRAIGANTIRGLSWKNVEIRNTPTGMPSVRLRGPGRDLLERSGVERIHITISHCRAYATAFAVAEG